MTRIPCLRTPSNAFGIPAMPALPLSCGPELRPRPPTAFHQVTSPRASSSPLPKMRSTPYSLSFHLSLPTTTFLLKEKDLLSDCETRQPLDPFDPPQTSFPPSSPKLASIVETRICRRTDRVIFHHRKRPVRAGPAEGSVVARQGHGDEADGYGAGFGYEGRRSSAFVFGCRGEGGGLGERVEG